MLNRTTISMPGGRAGTPGASYERTRREQESREDREARLDRQRLRTDNREQNNCNEINSSHTEQATTGQGGLVQMYIFVEIIH